jgi:hypothetical protein
MIQISDAAKLRKDSNPACNQSTLSHRNQLGYIPVAFVPARATIQRVGSTRKPVIVRKLTRDWCAGYATANPTEELDALELLDISGKLVQIAWEQVKWVCYVRELNPGDSVVPISGPRAPADDTGNYSSNPERLLRRRFSGRPRGVGIWLRIILRDGDELEGLAANDRSLVNGAGLLLTPPDTRSNTQRVFVPRSSIRELTVLGVINPSQPRSQAHSAKPVLQPELFERESNDQPPI